MKKRSWWMAPCILLVICVVFAACRKECVHDHQASVTTAASCTQDGVQTHICVGCGDSYTTPIPAVGHSYGAGVEDEAATCTKEGRLVYQCVACGDVKTEAIPCIDHVFDEGVSVREASCVQPGEMEFSCTSCGLKRSEEIPVVDHTMGDPVLTKEPNCTQEGERSAICTVCGVVELLDIIPVNDIHDFKETVKRPPTCVDAGEGEKRCTRCDKTVSVQYELTDHKYGSYYTVSKPTCAEKGTEERKCNICGDRQSRALDKKAHVWDTTECRTPATCTVCGYYNEKGLSHDYQLERTVEVSQNFPGRREYKCSKCGKNKREIFGKHGDYDLSALSSLANDYAKERGFQVVNKAKGEPFKRWGEYFASVELLGGQEYLEECIISLIDSAYERYKDYEGGVAARKIYIDVGNGSNGAIGSYTFTVHIYVYR